MSIEKRGYFLFSLAIVAGLYGSVFAMDNEVIPSQKELSPNTLLLKTLDWVHIDDMTDSQKEKLSSSSCGAYIDPHRRDKDATIEMKAAPLLVYSEDSEAPSESSVTLRGDVQISQGNREIRADRAQVNNDTRQVSFQGNVQFREPGLLLVGDQANIDIDNRNVTMNNVTYVIHEASLRGTAKKLDRTDQGTIIINESSYSTCEPSDSSWQLVTKQIEIDQDSGWATVKNARLEVKDIPVFYFPYLKVPIDDRRSSGLLIPNVDINQKNGLDYTQPIYWNIAANYDAIVAPRYIQHRGVGLEADFRYLNNWSRTDFSTGFLPNDKGGNDSEKIDPITGQYRNQDEDRYMFKLNHVGGVNQPWSTFIDYNKVSDLDYVRDFGNLTIDETSRTHLQQTAHASYKTSHWNYRIGSQDFQVVTQGLKDQYSVLPYVSIEGYYRFDNNLVVDLNNQYAIFKHNDPNKVEGSRSRIDYGISWDKRWSWGYLRPKVQLKHLAYGLNDNHKSSINHNDTTPEITVPVYSFDTSIFLERSSNWWQGHTQTLEPRLFYVKSAYKDQSTLPDFDTREFTPSYDLLFEDTRFVGGDRISDDERLTIGFTTRFLDQESGQEKFRASIAQSIYYADRLVSLAIAPTTEELANMGRDKSLLAMELAARINSNWRFNSDIVYNDVDHHMEKGGLSLRYNDRKKRLFNLTYRYTSRIARAYDGQLINQDIKQANVSAFVPLSNNFNLVGRWNHDFTNQRELEVFAGFEYNNCCWRASLVARRWLDRNDELLFPEKDLKAKNGVVFKIEFKGLAGTGRRLDAMLKNGIYGYEHNEQF